MHYSTGWELAARERAAIVQLPKHMWGVGSEGTPATQATPEFSSWLIYSLGMFGLLTRRG